MNDTVTLSRADYEALLERVEDAEDLAAVAVHRARETALGKQAARADHLPVELVERLVAGAHPVTIWREHRGLTRAALAQKAVISAPYLSELEGGKKPGSFNAMVKIARALGVSVDDLVPHR